ncbi:MAG: homoserine O-acetyltransferase [Fibrobacteres bacterium]|nr:homoserine O-acetyltransferase [Fibrobacterota bacterium]
MLVEKKWVELFNISDPLVLESGKSFSPLTVAYETLGHLSPKRDNVLLICHALTGDSHVAGKYSPDDKKPGWWDNMVGPGKTFDTNKYYIICSNIIGGCRGTTGPGSINPETGKEYALSFPVLTVEDMVRVQKKLLDHLGIERLLCVVGGSLGGMQALAWAVMYPETVRSAAVIASAAYTSAQAIAFNKVGRNAIMSDPGFENGNYYGKSVPEKGLSIARMIGHITYLSDESMRKKFSRNLQARDAKSFELSDDFAVESYLEYQGGAFVERFDANSYLYITKAMDYFDFPGKYGSLDAAVKNISAKMIVVSFSSDWLFPPYQSKEIVKALMRSQKDVSYCEIESSYGHDAFLLEVEKLSRIMESFLLTARTEE